MTASLETFAKVRALHDRAGTPGEKAAAAGRMEALARSAGMTVAEAVSRLDAAETHAARPGQFSFDDIFDSPVFHQAKADRERERAERWREILGEYGSEEAVFAPTPWERALEDACASFVVRAQTTGWRMGSLSGWDAYSFGDPPPRVVEAVSRAYHLPETVRAAWDEFSAWEKIAHDREARGTGSGDPAPEVRARTGIIERLLDTMPAHSLDDIRARLDWMDQLNRVENAPDPKDERVRLTTLRADIERMGERMRGLEAATAQNGREGHTERDAPLTSPDPGTSTAPVQSGHPRRPTRAERHATIRAHLAEGLTDREVARRLSISPTTVGAVRRAAGEVSR